MNKLRYWILASIAATTYITYQQVFSRTRMDAILTLSSPLQPRFEIHPSEINILINFYDGSTHEATLSLLDVQGNSLGLNPGINNYAVLDIKKFPDDVGTKLKRIFNPTHDIIIVSSDSREQPITDVGSTINRGTPGNILWENYIGRTKDSDLKDNLMMPGSTAFTDYCKGECVQKK